MDGQTLEKKKTIDALTAQKEVVIEPPEFLKTECDDTGL
jgi:hypothetical protein